MIPMNNKKETIQEAKQTELEISSFTIEELSYLHNLLMEREKFILNQNGKGMTEEQVDHEGQFLMAVSEKIFTVLPKE